MVPRDVEAGSTTEGLPLAPSLGPSLENAAVAAHSTTVDLRVVTISGLSIAVAGLAALIAQLLTRLIAFFTNLAFYGRLSTEGMSPAGHHLGAWVIAVPVIGGLVVGAMARYGSQAIRGHGIPEAMQQVLQNESRIPARMVWLKPLSAAIAIGTGGPFGAEGPIIATGGALGSLVGQLVATSASERKTLLAAGAAAGMAATFGTPVSAVLLAIELLLFEYRPRSLVPVALAAATGGAVRYALIGPAAMFTMPGLLPPTAAAFAGYLVIGALIGAASVAITRAVYGIEDAFEHLPVHFMWWPALGGLVVGGVGYFAPKTLGVGYDNIEQILGNHLLTAAIVVLCFAKLVSWSMALGSGTSGGTMAPLFTIGAGLGATLGSLLLRVSPELGIDLKVAALVGMASMFAGASRALLASVVVVFEMTRQPLALLPLLGACTTAFLSSSLLMRNSIMTEKIERRGVRALTEYTADFLERVAARDCGLCAVVTLRAEQSVATTRDWLASHAAGSSHQGFPVVDADERMIGVLTRRDLFDAEDAALPLRALIQRPPVVIHDDQTLRAAADIMAREHIGRLPVVTRAEPQRVLGILTRSDLIEAHSQRLDEQRRAAAWFRASRRRT